MKIPVAVAWCALAITPALAQQTPGLKNTPTKATARSTAFRVMIDAGHGGADTGLQTKPVEKDSVLQLALQLRTELERQGVQVMMTRANDTFLPLAQRVRLSSEFKPDSFLSLHSSVLKKASPAYTLYYFEPRGKALAESLSPSIKQAYTRGAQPSLLVKQARFYVLRQSAPSVLVGVDKQATMSAPLRANLVDALAKGTMSFLKSQPK